MLDQPENDQARRLREEIAARRVPLGDVARWFAPWILAGVLVLVIFAGLWCASSAGDDATYAIGIAAAALAFLALLWQLFAALGSGTGGAFAIWSVEDETSLGILIAVLTVLSVVGLVLAATVDSTAVNGAGYGLFVFGLVFIFANLKHYFDRRER